MKTPEIGWTEDAGRRMGMEDATVVSENQTGVFAGVFDGHGGEAAAVMAAQVLPDAFFAEGRNAKAMRMAYATAQEVMPEQSGACAVTVFVPRESRNIVYGWTGDCRLIVVGKNGNPPKQLTLDHRLENESERARVLAAGGSIEKHCGYEYLMSLRRDVGYMFTRSLGDKDAEAKLIHGILHVPETGTYSPEEGDGWLVLASDGVFDKLSNGDVAAKVRAAAGPQAAADALRKAVLAAGGEDNISVIVIQL